MQIHELTEYSGDPATNDVFPIDTGTHTFKLPFAELGEAIITTVSATISGVSQTVKAAIEALNEKTAYVANCTTNDDDLALAASQGKVLQDQVTALGAVSNTSMTFVGRSITLYKYGKVVTFSFGGNSTMDIPARTDFNAGTLPDGYRPAVTCTNYLFNSAQAMLQISFSNTGTVSLYNFGTTAIAANQGWMRGSYTFITP